MVYQYNYFASLLTVIGATTAPQIGNDYVQLGFLGILLTILIWYSKRSYSDNIRRDKAAEAEKKELIERYEKKLTDSEKRYHELHLEIMAFLQFKIKKND